MYGTVEQVSDIAIYRFVFSAEREKYQEILASAHALSVVRGVIVGSIAAAMSPLVAWAFSLTPDWPSFAALGGVTLIGSFEHLGPKVAERNYEYKSQLYVVSVSNGLGLLAIVTASILLRNHYAIIISLFAQIVGLVVASHIFAETRYRLEFRSPQFLRAIQYGYPLIVNGLGLAVTSQGDRFLVGMMLGLPALGIYSIALLTVIVPISMLFRIMGTLNLGRFHNAVAEGSSLDDRLRVSARFSPMAATIYAMGVINCMG